MQVWHEAPSSPRRHDNTTQLLRDTHVHTHTYAIYTHRLTQHMIYVVTTPSLTFQPRTKTKLWKVPPFLFILEFYFTPSQSTMMAGIALCLQPVTVFFFGSQ